MFDSNTLGFVASIFTMVSFIPQVYRAWKTKRTKDISMPMYIILNTGALLWFFYGLMLHAQPVIIVNAVVFILGCFILYLKIKHG